MHARPLKILGLIAPMFAMGAGGAYTGALTTADIFSQFNAVIFGNFSTSSDVEGRTIVGGNLTGGATFDLNPVGAAASAYSALSVYGSATSAGSYNVNNAGGIAIAGSNAASFNLNGGGSAYVGGANSGSLTLQNGIGSLAVVGSNSGTLQLGSGGTVYVGGTTGGINTTGSATVSINGNNTANLNINGGGTVSLNGSNLGTVSLNGGSLAYTGSQSGNLNLNGGATATKVASLALSAPTSTLGSFATTFQAPLTALSTQLNTLAVTSAATSANGAITFNATPNSSGVAVFDVNTSLFAANSTVNVKLGGATSVIVNVNVDSCVSSNCSFSLPNSVNFANPTGYAAAVLWNFVNATSLTFTNEFGGTGSRPAGRGQQQWTDRRHAGRGELQRQRRASQPSLQRDAHHRCIARGPGAGTSERRASGKRPRCPCHHPSPSQCPEPTGGPPDKPPQAVLDCFFDASSALIRSTS